MIRQGDSIENRVTGERLVFLKTAQETNRELVVVEAFVKPTGFVASAHLHPDQEERVHVLRGTVGFRLHRSSIYAGPGERITVPAGTPHKFCCTTRLIDWRAMTACSGFGAKPTRTI